MASSIFIRIPFAMCFTALFFLSVSSVHGEVQVAGDIDGEAAGDFFGWSVSLSSDGSRVAIGAPHNDGSADNAGHVRIYDDIGGTWTQVGVDIDGEAVSDMSGISVSLSSDGSRVAIGAHLHDGSGGNEGHVRIYDDVGGTWTQVGSDIDGEAAFDLSGWSVSLSSDGRRVAIGAQDNDGSAPNGGHVRIYDDIGGTWTQVGSDIDGETMNERTGYSVSLSSDGSRIAIGAPFSSASAGHVRIYDLVGGTWTQVGSDIVGEVDSEWLGWSVSLSSDGNRVAIGAPPSDDGSAFNAGHVVIYDLVGGTWSQVGSDIDGEGGF